MHITQIWFGLVFFLTIVPVWVFCKIVALFPISGKQKRKIVIPVILGGFHLIFGLCPWVRLPSIDFHSLRVKERGCVVLMNHVSLMDPLGTCAIMPLFLGERVRTFLKSDLLNIPFFGYVVGLAGHFPVYFKATTEGAFSTDKERMAEVMKGVQEFVDDGGTLCLYPEGQVNRKDCTKLQAFRYGTFDIAIKNSLPIYAIISINAEHCWPHRAPIGGKPTKMTGKLIKIYDPLPGNMRDAPKLAEHCQKRMQEELDALYASAGSKKGQ